MLPFFEYSQFVLFPSTHTHTHTYFATVLATKSHTNASTYDLAHTFVFLFNHTVSNTQYSKFDQLHIVFGIEWYVLRWSAGTSDWFQIHYFFFSSQFDSFKVTSKKCFIALFSGLNRTWDHIKSISTKVKIKFIFCVFHKFFFLQSGFSAIVYRFMENSLVIAFRWNFTH